MKTTDFLPTDPDLPAIPLNVLTRGDLEDIDRTFKHHPPTGNKGTRFDLVRSMCKHLAARLRQVCPESDERESAERMIQETMFWANAAIARHPEPKGPTA